MKLPKWVRNPPNVRTPPPGPKAKGIIERDDLVFSPSYTRTVPFVVKEGFGSVVRDVDDNTYIDFTSAISVLNVGHANPEVVQAIREQAEKFTHFAGSDWYYEVQVEFAEELVKIAPGKEEKRVFFANSGAEATECAFKLARYHRQRPRMVAFIGCFHGRTLGALTLTPQKLGVLRRFAPLVPGAVYTPYADCSHCYLGKEYPDCELGCVQFLENVVFETYCPPEEVAGLILEPIIGGGGVIVPPPEFLPEIRRICDEHEILMIVDEVHTGLGRTGKMYAVEHWNVVPDVVTHAKALASGIPMSAVIAKEDVMQWEYGAHATTFSGNPLGAAAGLASLNIIQREKLPQRAAELGAFALDYLQDLKEEVEIVKDVRGKGLLIGVELVDEVVCSEVIQKAFRKGLLTMGAGFNTVRVVPPLTIEKELLEKGLEILADSVREVER